MVTLKITNIGIRTNDKGKEQKEVFFDILFTSEGNNLFDGFRIKSDSIAFKLNASDDQIEEKLAEYLKPFNEAFNKKDESTQEEKDLNLQRKSLVGKKIKSNGN